MTTELGGIRCVIRITLMLRWCDPLVKNSLTFVE